MPKKENILFHKPSPGSKSHVTILVVFISVVALVFLYYGYLVPTGAQSTCVSDADCPSGYSCQVTPMCPTCKACIQNTYAECYDETDNDLDGYMDLADQGCSGSQDNDETNCGDNVCEGGETWQDCLIDCRSSAPQCSNGIDDDKDDFVDCADPGCTGLNNVCDPNDNDEILFNKKCCITNSPMSPEPYCTSDTQTQCTGTWKEGGCNTKTNCLKTVCNNKIDDDWDTFIDLSDFACNNNPSGQSEKASINCAQACLNSYPSTIIARCEPPFISPTPVLPCTMTGWVGPVHTGLADCQDVYKGSKPFCCCKVS